MEASAIPEDLKLGIIHSVDNYYVSNEGSKKYPAYHVWVPGITHSTCDSAYADLSCAVARCNYLAKNKIQMQYEQPMICGQTCDCENNSECKF